jgi:hypothetical protein
MKSHSNQQRPTYPRSPAHVSFPSSAWERPIRKLRFPWAGQVARIINLELGRLLNAFSGRAHGRQPIPQTLKGFDTKAQGRAAHPGYGPQNESEPCKGSISPPVSNVLLQTLSRGAALMEPLQGSENEGRLPRVRCATLGCDLLPFQGSSSGSTLTEVLVALLIMSIGIVSVATMFPLSILRSIRGTQETNATDHRYNFESMIDLNPKMITDPDLDGNVIEHDPPYPGTNPNTTRFVIDPFGWSELSQSRQEQGVGAAHEIQFGNDPLLGGALRADAFGIPRYNLNRFSAAYKNYINTIAAGTYPTPVTDDIDEFVALPDSWSHQYEARAGSPIVVSYPAGSGIVAIDVTGLSGTGLALAGNSVVRAVIFDAEGVLSESRVLTYIDGDTIYWTEDAVLGPAMNNALDVGEDDRAPAGRGNGNGSLDHNLLPANFMPGIVRIEVQERRYTWLLTVRRTGTSTFGTPVAASVDVVIYFKRGGLEINAPNNEEALSNPASAPGRIRSPSTIRR